MYEFCRVMAFVLVAVLLFLMFKTYHKPSLFWKKWGWSLIGICILASVPIYFMGAGIGDYSIAYMVMLVAFCSVMAFSNYFKYRKGDMVESPEVKEKKSFRTILKMIIIILIGASAGYFVYCKANGIDFLGTLFSWDTLNETIWMKVEKTICAFAGIILVDLSVDYIKRVIKGKDNKNKSEANKK